MAQAWPPEEARQLRARARNCFQDHNPAQCRRLKPWERESCGACALAGYEPRGGHGDPEFKVSRDGPNYAGWARLYVEAGRTIPANWRNAFRRELASDNRAYANALDRSIETFGVRFSDGRGMVEPLPAGAWGLTRTRSRTARRAGRR